MTMGFHRTLATFVNRGGTRTVVKAKRIYKHYKPLAWEERRTYLGAQANELADRDEPGKGSEYYYWQLIQQEEEKQSFQKIQYTFKPAREGVSRVEVKNEDGGTRDVICDKDRIEQEITGINIEKLLQANNMPLQMEPLSSYLGESGDLRNGTTSPLGNCFYQKDGKQKKELDFGFKNQSTKYDTKVPDWEPDEYTYSWREMDEHTTSLPGSAFIHFKAPKKGIIASVVHSLLGLIPLLLGIAPTGWCKAMALMIP